MRSLCSSIASYPTGLSGVGAKPEAIIGVTLEVIGLPTLNTFSGNALCGFAFRVLWGLKVRYPLPD